MYSIPMGLVDLIPVLFFGAAAHILKRDLYNKMGWTSYALFSAGTVMVLMAGCIKALHKILYAAGICDFQTLNTSFFLLQSMGFLFTGIALVMTAANYKYKKKKDMWSVAPPVFSGTMIFVVLMCLDLGALVAALCHYASVLKKKWLIVVFILSFVFSLGMGYLSSRDATSNTINWISEAVNICGQGLMFYGVLKLDKAGLREYVANRTSVK